MKFDLVVFHTLLKHIYKVSSIDEACDLDPKEYIETYLPLFNQSFLDESRKIDLLIESINKNAIDILFIQEANSALIEYLKSDERFFLATSEDQDTLILASKKAFTVMRDLSSLTEKLDDKEWMEMNWKGHTCLMVVDQFLLICGHLASKKSENEKNVKSLKTILPIVRSKFCSYEIICGCDCNAYIDNFS